MRWMTWIGVLTACSHSHHNTTDGGSSGSDGGGSGGNGTWSVVSGVTTDNLASISGTGAGDVWIAGMSTLWHGDGTSWTTAALPPGVNTPPFQYVAVFAAAAGNEWLSTGELKGPVWNLVGTTWTSYALGDNRQVGTLSGTSTSDVWGVEPGVSGVPGYTGHWDGSAWTHVDSISSGGIWGATAGMIWVLDAGACIETLTGAGACSTLSQPMPAVWGTSATDLWAVGTGRAAHGNGTTWTEQALPASNALHAVWASGADDYWAVGDAGTIVHYNGSAWSSITSPTNSALRAIWGASSTDIWAVGDAGTILHFH